MPKVFQRSWQLGGVPCQPSARSPRIMRLATPLSRWRSAQRANVVDQAAIGRGGLGYPMPRDQQMKVTRQRDRGAARAPGEKIFEHSVDQLEARKPTGLIGPWRGAWCVVETALILVAAAPASLSRARGTALGDDAVAPRAASTCQKTCGLRRCNAFIIAVRANIGSPPRSAINQQ